MWYIFVKISTINLCTVHPRCGSSKFITTCSIFESLVNKFFPINLRIPKIRIFGLFYNRTCFWYYRLFRIDFRFGKFILLKLFKHIIKFHLSQISNHNSYIFKHCIYYLSIQKIN